MSTYYYPSARGRMPMPFQPRNFRQRPIYTATPLNNRRRRLRNNNQQQQQKLQQQPKNNNTKPLDASKILNTNYNIMCAQIVAFVKANGKFLDGSQKSHLHKLLPESNESRVVVAGQAIFPALIQFNPAGPIKAHDLSDAFKLLSHVCANVATSLDLNHSYGQGTRLAISGLSFEDAELKAFRSRGFVLTEAAVKKYLPQKKN